MPRVHWDGPGRVRRLSAYAVELLMRLCAPGACIVFSATDGTFWLCLEQVRHQRVTAKNVEVLALPRLIRREPDAPVALYTITDRGRDMMRQRAHRLCADDGRTCPVCDLSTCPYITR